MRIAVIGSGIAGLSAAFFAQDNGHEVHLFEKGNYFGGHSNTIEINDGIKSFFADTGFLVHNPHTYPNLIELLKYLDVKTDESQMTLSIQALDAKIEWGGTNLDTLFAQRSNLLKPQFYRMIKDILKFNKNASIYLDQLRTHPNKTLGELLIEYNYSSEVRDWYLVPMAAAIWSTPANKILDFPAFTFIQFCLNHNLLQVEGRPTWRTVEGGAREYVKKLTDQLNHKYLNVSIRSIERQEGQIKINFNTKTESFDRLIMATHADQVKHLILDLTPEEKEILGKFNFQPNLAVVHSDISVLPKRKKIWSAWNYVTSKKSNQVSVSYLINHLQKLPTKMPVIVTLNPNDEIDPKYVIRKIQYDHPVFDPPAIEAQLQMQKIQGIKCTYYTGAWLGYGFHEDGLKSALRVAREMNWRVPWKPVYE